MKIYFGKISNKYDLNQLSEGYYEAPINSTWFNGLSIGDYAYIIGGGKIQLWQAKEWRKSSKNTDRLYFEITNSDLKINIAQFVMFKFFYLDITLIIKTSRSTAVEEKAFFPIQFEDFEIMDYSLFHRKENYRKLVNRVIKENAESNSYDIQLYFENDKVCLSEIQFSDSVLKSKFNPDVFAMLGKGSVKKDRILRRLLDGKSYHTEINDVGLQGFYDTFMCPYKMKKDRKLRNYWVVNGFELDKIKYDLENDVIVMQQQYHDQNTSAVTTLLNKSLRIKEGDGVLLYNKNKYYAYSEFKAVDFGSIEEKRLKDQITEKSVVDNQLVVYTDASCFYEDTRTMNGFKGAFGQRLYVDQWEGIHENGINIEGISKAADLLTTTIISLYDSVFYDKVVRILNGDKFYLIEKVMNELKELLEFKKQIILQGPPGTGKTYTAKDLAEYVLTGEVSVNKDDQAAFINTNERVEIIQFHPAYTYEDFIRGIVTETAGDKIKYVSKDKLFLELVSKAKNGDGPYILIIDEINRANLSSVLGELIYALEYRGQVFKSMYADESNNYEISIPDNLWIIGTMNTADRSVGHIDYALRRRFAFYDVLPKVTEDEFFEKELFEKVSGLFVKEIKEHVNELEASEHLSMEFQDRPQDIWLGHSYFFRKPEQDFKLRVKYEIVPILQEYVKDGILNNTDDVQSIIKSVLNYQGIDVNS